MKPECLKFCILSSAYRIDAHDLLHSIVSLFYVFLLCALFLSLSYSLSLLGYVTKGVDGKQCHTAGRFYGGKRTGWMIQRCAIFGISGHTESYARKKFLLLFFLFLPLLQKAVEQEARGKKERRRLRYKMRCGNFWHVRVAAFCLRIGQTFFFWFVM